MFSIILPTFNPVAVALGPLEIRWYALSYIFGLIIGILYAYYLEKNLNHFTNTKHKRKFFEDYLTSLAIAIILGGRIGYILFYNLPYYLDNPIKIFYVWEGGMSFHGALIACIITIFIFAKFRNFNPLILGDLTAAAAPIGIFFGRIANFVNQELPGRVTNMPWGVIFNNDTVPRHPSELYEALLEGLVLFFILLFAFKGLKLYKKPGLIGALFLVFYGFFRAFIEFFREPDQQIGYIFNYFTLGQLFSVLMLLFGILMFCYINTTTTNDQKSNKKTISRRNSKTN